MTESTCFTADASFERTVGTNESNNPYYNHRPNSSSLDASEKATPKYLEVISSQSNLLQSNQIRIRDDCSDRDGYELPIDYSKESRPRIRTQFSPPIYDKPNKIVIKADVIASLNEHELKRKSEGNLSPPPTYSQVFSDNFPPNDGLSFSPDNESDESDGHPPSQHPSTSIPSSSDGSMHFNHYPECDGTQMHDNIDDENDHVGDVKGGFNTNFFLQTCGFIKNGSFP